MPDVPGLGWRVFFVAAGLLNLIGGTLGWLDPARPFTDAGLPAPLYPYAFELLFSAVLLFGIGYLMVAAAPLAHRGIVVLGLGSKIAGTALTWRAAAAGQAPPGMEWQPLFVDIPWALGFALFLWRFRTVPHASVPSTPPGVST